MGTKELLEKETNDESANVKKNKIESKSPKKSIAKTIKKILIVAICVVCAFLAGKCNKGIDRLSPFFNNEVVNFTPDIDVTYLNKSLKEASDLTTAKLTINGLVDFKDTGIVILNKSDFVMKYTADISAGIDMAKVEIKEEDIDHENKKIIVRIPKATVFKPNVYHGDEYIKFYGERFAIFNVNEKEDLSRALALAEKDAEKEAVKSGLLELADKQSEAIIKGILSDAVSPIGYTVEIQYLKEEK